MVRRGDDDDLLAQFLMLYAEASSLACEEERRRLEEKKREGTRIDCPHIPRQRKSVVQVYRELGSTYFRRSFRMSYGTFRRLYRTLEEDLKRESGLKRHEEENEKTHMERTPNWPVDLTVRLTCALRFFAGGEAYDIACMFGVSHSSVFESIDVVIDAINKCKELNISFPRYHGSIAVGGGGGGGGASPGPSGGGASSVIAVGGAGTGC